MSQTLKRAQTVLSALPEELPIFPLTGAVLLPHARLPLNIFEPRYLAMVEDALGKGRLIGMIQPSVTEDVATPPLYSIGCAGRISSFNETDEGTLLIVLSGVCRFRIVEERQTTKLYRTIKPDWKSFIADLGENGEADIDREHLIDLLKIYLKKNSISVDWNVVKNAPNDVLVPIIVMICPLAPNEKQALLEAESFAARARMLMTLMEMAVMPQTETEAEVRH
jgi:Lon protease-like protein